MDSSRFERFVSNAFCNVGQSFYDSYVEVNVTFRSRIGMKNVIIRRQLGNCCDWCRSVAGIYDASNMSDNVRENIYRRHNNCRCLVTFKTEKGYQNVWNKKEYKKQRDSRIDRLKEIESDEAKFKKFVIERRKLKSTGNKVYDATEEWYTMSKPDTATIIKKENSIRIDGEDYQIGKYVYYNLNEYEIDLLEKLVNTFGGRLMYCPKVDYPLNVSTPECFFRGEKLDIKTPGKDNPVERKEDALFRIVRKNKRQAHKFLIDIDKLGISREDATKQAEALFTRKETSFVDLIIIYQKSEFFKVLERI